MNDGYITKDELVDIGVQLDDAAFKKLLDELNEEVASLIGEEIIESLTPDDVAKLADMQDTASEDELATWVVDRVPDYPEIIENNKAIVLGEYIESSDLDEEE
ncbi:MAG: hypothetical protein JWO07_357 [Candidatus Saccharibacteria bacterium]|nr:hypothetical protein [Candidatus Saccharibacteria bacterium]